MPPDEDPDARALPIIEALTTWIASADQASAIKTWRALDTRTKVRTLLARLRGGAPAPILAAHETAIAACIRIIRDLLASGTYVLSYGEWSAAHPKRREIDPDDWKRGDIKLGMTKDSAPRIFTRTGRPAEAAPPYYLRRGSPRSSATPQVPSVPPVPRTSTETPFLFVHAVIPTSPAEPETAIIIRSLIDHALEKIAVAPLTWTMRKWQQHLAIKFPQVGQMTPDQFRRRIWEPATGDFEKKSGGKRLPTRGAPKKPG